MSESRKKVESLAQVRFARPSLDPYVVAQLTKIREEDTNAPARLYNYYLNRIRIVRTRYLYPREPTYDEGDSLVDAGELPEASLPTLPRDPDHFQREMEKHWNSLKKELRYVAEVIWRQYFTTSELDDHKFRLFRRPRRFFRNKVRYEEIRALHREVEIFTQQARSFLLLWLETEFYFLRAINNMNFYSNLDRNQRAMRARFRTLIHMYDTTRRAWDRELGMRLFVAQAGDAERLKALSKEFGPNRVGSNELGWVTEASSIGDELRYHYFNELQNECWYTLRRWPEALWLAVLRGLIGYGVRPMRFLFSTVVIVLAFTLAFFLDVIFDQSSSCRPAGTVVGWDIPSVLNNLQLAILNLTGIGKEPPQCGIDPVLHPTAAIVGYFLLATLSALFIEQLMDSER